jgi:hypothetical protein
VGRRRAGNRGCPAEGPRTRDDGGGDDALFDWRASYRRLSPGTGGLAATDPADPSTVTIAVTNERETAMTQPTSGSGGESEAFATDSDTEFEDVALEQAESLDSDDLGELDDGGDPLDDGWDAPDRPSPASRFGYTAEEQRDGESLDELLAEEIPDPDPYVEAERLESGAVLDADVLGNSVARGAARRPAGSDSDDDSDGGSGDLGYYRLEDEDTEAGATGELVGDDEGAHDVDTAELTAHSSRRTDRAKPSTDWPTPSEEGAVHVHPER